MKATQPNSSNEFANSLASAYQRYCNLQAENDAKIEAQEKEAVAKLRTQLLDRIATGHVTKKDNNEIIVELVGYMEHAKQRLIEELRKEGLEITSVNMGREEWSSWIESITITTASIEKLIKNNVASPTTNLHGFFDRSGQEKMNNVDRNKSVVNEKPFFGY